MRTFRNLAGQDITEEQVLEEVKSLFGDNHDADELGTIFTNYVYNAINNGTLTETTNGIKNIENKKENKIMKTYDEKVEAIKNIIKDMDDSDAVALHNEYCYETNDYDDEIIEMERFDEICEGMTPSEIARSIVYGDFNPNHDYFHYNGYGNFESTDCPTDWIYPGDIAREVVDRECAFENDEIQEEIDSWSEDDEDDEEEEDSEKETDETEEETDDE